jgi:hypothetical protein
LVQSILPSEYNNIVGQKLFGYLRYSINFQG